MKKILTWKEYNNILKFRQKFEVIEKKNKIKLFFGVCCIIIAIIPNGLGIFFYPLGIVLLGIKKEIIIKKMEDLKFKLKGY